MSKIMFVKSNATNITTPPSGHSNLFIDVADGFIKVRNPDGTITNYGPSSTVGNANAYTDQKIAELINAAPELLDTLKELADAINNDPDFAGTIVTQISNESAARLAADGVLQGNIDAEALARQTADGLLDAAIDAEEAARIAAVSAEASARIAADSALDARLDAIEAAPEPDEVRFYASEAAFPESGDQELIYVAKDVNKLYRYDLEQSGESLVADYTVGSGGDFANLAAAMASGSVVNGTKLKILPGTYSVSSTININKSVIIFSDGKAGAIFETAGTGSDPVSMFNVSVDDVTIRDLTIKHKKTTNTSVESAVVVSGPGFPQTRVANFKMDSCRIEHVEFGLTIRGSAWKLANNEFVYKGPNNSTRRHVGIYGVSGNCFASNNQSHEDIAVGVTGNTRWFAVTSTTGTNPNETLEGQLILDGNVQSSGNVQQFYSQDAWQGTAGSFKLIAKNNTTNETSAFISFYGTSANFGNILSEVSVEGNHISNLHGGTPAGGKGLIGIDGAGAIAFRSSALPVHHSGNVLSNLTFRTDYVEATGSSGSLVGRNSSAISSASVSLDSSVLVPPNAPSTPGDVIIIGVYKALGINAAELAAAVGVEEAARIAADLALDARLDILEADPVTKTYVNNQDASNLVSAKAYADAAVAVEKSRAEAAEGALDGRLDIIEGSGAGSIAQSLVDAKAYADAAVLVEKGRAESAESALDGRLDVLEGSGAGSVAKAQADAQAYADQKVADLVNSAPAVLDTLKELSDALGSDPNFATTIAGQIGDEAEARQLADEGLQDNIDAEAQARQDADQDLQDAIDAEVLARQGGDQALENSKVAKSGDTMSGALAMGNNKITGLANGTNANDAVNKSQLDTKQNSLGTGTTTQFLRGDLTWQEVDNTPEVQFADNFAALPVSGDVTKLYVTKDLDKLWYYKPVMVGETLTYVYTPVAESKHIQELSWSGMGPYTMSVPASVHGMGTEPVVIVRELIDGEWLDCIITEVKTNNQGDVTLSIAEPIQGKIVIK